MNYMENEKVKALIANAPEYRKLALTGLRKVKFTTYVKDGDTLRVEVERYLPGCVIARNPEPIGELNGQIVYNEWPITLETAIKNYGQDVIDSLTDEFSFHQKIATIKAIELTPEVMTVLGVTGDILYIPVGKEKEPRMAKVGDYITNAGYSVSAHDMASTYEKVSVA